MRRNFGLVRIRSNPHFSSGKWVIHETGGPVRNSEFGMGKCVLFDPPSRRLFGQEKKVRDFRPKEKWNLTHFSTMRTNLFLSGTADPPRDAPDALPLIYKPYARFPFFFGLWRLEVLRLVEEIDKNF